MKVLSNLLGNDAKINANAIVYKDSNGNIDTLDDIITDSKGTVLYQSASGTSSSFSLSENVNNFKKILVTFSRSSRGQMDTKVLDIEEIGSASIPLIIVDAGGGNFIIYGCRISFSGTSVSITNNGAREVLSSSATINTSGYNILVHKIVGYK